jgi:oligoendopeptidase F
MKFTKLILACTLLALLASMVFAQGIKDRSQIPDKYKWRFSDIYKTLDDWQKDFDYVKASLDKLAAFKGQFAGDKATNPAKALVEFNKLSDEVGQKFEHMFTYVSFNYDVDLTNQDWSGKEQMLQVLGVEYGQKLAWTTPELLKIPQETMHKYIKENPVLEQYRKGYDDMYALQAHVLSEKEEEILALSGNITETASDVFGKLTDVDLKFGYIEVPRRDANGAVLKDAKGNVLKDSVEVNDNGYVNWRTDQDRQVREDFFKVLFEGYNQYGNTIAALMNGNVMKNVYLAKARKYDNTLNAALYSAFIPEAVYTNLVATARKNTAPLHKYNVIRKRLLGVDHYRHWDYYASVIEGPETRMPWEQAVTMITDALKPLGPKYIEDITRALNPGSGWVDPFTSKAKRGGAYSGGCYGVHPFMLYNFDVDKGLSLEDVGTIAHEVGHSMHTYYSEKTQAYPNKNYDTFNAEVASTTNEALLNAKLLDDARKAYKKASGAEKEKARLALMGLLESNLSGARDTFYRQTMFADFELAVNRMGENGEPITKESLDTLYYEDLKLYQGPALEYEPLSSVEWHRIPHFYRVYYVYAYATSYAAAIALANDIQAEAAGDKAKKGARDRYLAFLGSGSSKHPVELLKDAGVDMTTPAPIESCVKWYSTMVEELDELTKVAQKK